MNKKLQVVMEMLKLSSISKAAKILKKQPKGNIILFPKNELEYNYISENSTWFSTGSDPQFIAKLSTGNLHKGWYMFEIKIHAPTPSARAKLYIDDNSGHSEKSSLSLVFPTGRVAKRLVYIPGVCSHIRFDPLEFEGHFQIDILKLSRVPKWFAIDRIVKKVRNNDPTYSKMSTSEVQKHESIVAKEKNIEPLEQLYSTYNNIFEKQKVIGPAKAWTYSDWIKKYERTDELSDYIIKRNIKEFDLKPKISIVLPTYNSDISLLEKCIRSVTKQSYSNWELCIADDCSTEDNVIEFLESLHTSDERVKVIFRSENGHISASSNTALNMTTGEYTVLLDHDDELADHAFYEVVSQINETPNALLIYSDEDKLDFDGQRCEPNFKPDWNPDLLNSQNYICHLAVYKTDLLKETGGFRIGVEGSQDHDLLLRYTQGLDEQEIIHIPKILYHWRKIEESTASCDSAKSYTTTSGINALENSILKSVPGANIKEGMLPNTYRVQYPIPKDAPLVSLLIPTRDQVGVLETCITSILEKTEYTNYEIVIIDNQSEEPETLEYFDEISKNENIRVEKYDKPFNYSAINNYGVTKANGSIIGLINNDIEVINGEWLTEMVSQSIRSEIGCVGAKLYYSNDQIQHAGVILGLGGVAGHSHKYANRESLGYVRRLKVVQNMSAVTAACLLVRKSVFEEVGGLNDKDLAVAFNDVDFCLKVREVGYRNLWTPYAELYHHESISRGLEDTPEKKKRFSKEVEYMKNTWGESLLNDPAYNPNLSKDTEDFSLAA